jgi:hypothetical protein
MARATVIRLEVNISKVLDLEESREKAHIFARHTSYYIGQTRTHPGRGDNLVVDEGKLRKIYRSCLVTRVESILVGSTKGTL